jgi:hypothetical protein
VKWKKRQRIKGVWIEETWIEFIPSPLSIMSVLDENINFIPYLISSNVAGSRLQLLARKLHTTIQLLAGLK